MKKIVILALLVVLVGCGSLDSMTDGFKHSQEVAADLEKAVGEKPFVGFNWANGSLTSVSVTFNGLPADKSIQELVNLSRSSIAAHFKQRPKQIVVAFSVADAP